uniref:7-dehydrocholesterol reductase n=1 Tax=Odontella aurita TaxID=265563 RepID=A0A7S4JWF6_9STRA|mmetsp:Transcript_54974/g.164687  ORF Transcript_54974/g.164687 Transcript_54974/m.164687 type:complete len:507 (+) Transcript_54974:117-1637(+)
MTASTGVRQRPAAKASAATAANGASSDKPAANPSAASEEKKQADKYDEGTNFVEAGIEDNAFLFALIVAAPFLSLLLAYLTSEEMATSYPDLATRPFTGMLAGCTSDPAGCVSGVLSAGMSVVPTPDAIKFVLSFMGVALVLERVLPGKVESGPETLTGHVPKYVDNGVLHCVVYTLLFWAGSNLGPLEGEGLYDFGIIYDVFPGSVAFLNIFGLLFCVFLTLKGLYSPSTEDSGSSGSWVKDYLWGTELYPRVLGLDLKRFVNCRFSMTYWQLAGLSFCYRSYTLHGSIDYGLAFSALSQYLYLFKFFLWEMGYMRSIDIIVDRAGFEIQWGCLVWVPAVYTLHSRFLVQYPSGWSPPAAAGLFVLSILGVLLNYLADRERDVFRATKGEALVWGKKPQFIEATYEVVDRRTGKKTQKTSLLLASGFWGVARHFQYFFELTAAWSWCLLANPFENGVIPLFYAAFLTYLLIDRAERDSKKCHLKYGKYYEEYCKLVPYKILPGLY